MKFYGEGKVTFADSNGPFHTVRFISGEYETNDATEIALLERQGFRSDKRKGKTHESRKNDNSGNEE
jgi:hypothetical protein